MDNPSYTTLRIPSSRKHVINHVYSKLRSYPVVNMIFLFGNCAKGNANEESDVDIFVVTSRSIHDDSDEAFGYIYDVADDIPLDKYVSCDILSVSAEDFNTDATPLVKAIKSEGIMLNGIL